MRELVLPGGFDPVSPSFTVRDIITELSKLRLTSCRTEM
ncbi:unnamed protein product [Schistosoma margrebowiei]|uniref:Uncharacterized protein n=1 Tax=Schistosoma margrebowiei TaxID=48269 RepID=A0A3P8A149_9TREM|nr:unnamed protein product [Schistosoma margrebowiei]